MFYIYLLQSDKDHNYYIGHSGGIKERLKEHNNGLVRSTKYRRPLRLIGYEIYKTRDEARWREYNLKKSAWRRKKFIKELKNKDRDGLRLYEP